MWRPGWEVWPFKLSLNTDSKLKAEFPAQVPALGPSSSPEQLAGSAAHPCRSLLHKPGRVAPLWDQSWPASSGLWKQSPFERPSLQPRDRWRFLKPLSSPRSVKPTSKPTLSLCYSDTWCCKGAPSRGKREDGSKSSTFRKACIFAQPLAISHWQANVLIFEHKGFFGTVFIPPHLWSEKKELTSPLPPQILSLHRVIPLICTLCIEVIWWAAKSNG